MPKPRLGPRDHTNPLIWCFSIICAIIAVAVIIGGIVIFVGYLTIKPKVPQISVQSAQVGTLWFDQSSLLTVQVTVVVKAENDNQKADATFYDTALALSFEGQKISYLMADPFDVPANQSRELNYVLPSTPIPLNAEEAEIVNLSFKRGVITFELKGKTRTRWRIWLLGSVRFWLDLDCQLHLPTNLSPIYSPPRCSSRSK